MLRLDLAFNIALSISCIKCNRAQKCLSGSFQDHRYCSGATLFLLPNSLLLQHSLNEHRVFFVVQSKGRVGTGASALVLWGAEVPSPLESRGPGTILNWGGGGKRLPGAKVTLTQNETFPGFRPILFGRDPSSRAKTNKNKNERH